MSEALDRTPAPSSVAATQWKAVGWAVRREVVVAAILLAAGKLVQGFSERAAGETLALVYLDEVGFLAGLAAFLFPLLVWKGEEPFGFSTLWTLPVDHARHAIVKVVAGWGWAMALTAGFGALMLLPVLITGGPLVERVTTLLVEPSGTRPIQWSTPAWWWLLPFGAATATYLLGSALVLATPHPLRWLAGAGFLLFALWILGEHGADPMAALLDRLVSDVGFSRYGLETLLTSGAASVEVQHRLPSGEEVVAWRELPSLARWGTAVLLWSAVGLAGLATATWSNLER